MVKAFVVSLITSWYDASLDSYLLIVQTKRATKRTAHMPCVPAACRIVLKSIECESPTCHSQRLLIWFALIDQSCCATAIHSQIVLGEVHLYVKLVFVAAAARYAVALPLAVSDTLTTLPAGNAVGNVRVEVVLAVALDVVAPDWILFVQSSSFN